LRFIGLGPNELAQNPQIAVSVYDDAGVPEDTLRVLRGVPRKYFSVLGST